MAIKKAKKLNLNKKVAIKSKQAKPNSYNIKLTPKLKQKTKILSKLFNLGRKKSIAIIVLLGLTFCSLALVAVYFPSVIADNNSKSVLGWRVRSLEASANSNNQNSIIVSWKTGRWSNGGADFYVVYLNDVDNGRTIWCGQKIWKGTTSQVDSNSGVYKKQDKNLTSFHTYTISGDFIHLGSTVKVIVEGAKHSKSANIGVSYESLDYNVPAYIPPVTTGTPEPIPTNTGEITYAKWYNKNSKEARLIGSEVAQVRYLSNQTQDGYTLICYDNNGVSTLNTPLSNKYNSDTYRVSNDYYYYYNRKCYVSGYKWYSSIGQNLWGPSREITH